MIDTNKLIPKRKEGARLSKKTITTIEFIKKDVVKIDSLLKEKLVLSKVRYGILRQQNERSRRFGRESALESKKSRPQDYDANLKTNKRGKGFGGFLGGILKSILGVLGFTLFKSLPGLLRIGKMIKIVAVPFTALVGVAFLTLRTIINVGSKIAGQTRGLDPKKINREAVNKGINTFAGALVQAAGAFAAGVVGSIVAQRIVRGRVVGIKEAEEIGARSVFEDVEKRKRITKRIQPKTKLVKKSVDYDSNLSPRENIERLVDFERQKEKRMVRKTQLGLRQTTDDRISVGMAPEDSRTSSAKFGDTPSTGRGGRRISKKISPDVEPITKVEKVMAKNKAKGIAAENLMRRIKKPTQAERMADAFEGLRQAGKTKRGVITAGKMNQAERLAQTATNEQRVLARATTRAAKERATKLATKKGLSRILFQFGGEALEQSVKQVVKQSIGTLPLIGDLIGLILDITLFDQPVGRAAFMAGGSILGGIIGGIFGLIGGPPGVLVGSILGGISGDLLGGSFYDLIFRREGPSLIESGGQSAVKKLVKSGGLPGFFGGGNVPFGGIVHAGEFVIDADSTRAIERQSPGFLMALNKAKGSQVDEVLETYMSYGNDGEGTETLVPIPFEKIITRTVTTSGGGEDSDDSTSPFMDLYRRG